jgi:hypothetical protein
LSVLNPVPVIFIIPFRTGDAEVGEMAVIETEVSRAVYVKSVFAVMDP